MVSRLFLELCCLLTRAGPVLCREFIWLASKVPSVVRRCRLICSVCSAEELTPQHLNISHFSESSLQKQAARALVHIGHCPQGAPTFRTAVGKRQDIDQCPFGATAW